ncbi:DUF3604 domain-containing protein [Nonomuraea sp. NBC_01738]|uniref:DUF3604 domain-containing protein n=1 Tax=Nonomuraea sp. NBC_01738 TaxID=2976003 RepID=UPI002E15AC2A|nr:DUF3604 domain-containing protein [Nonomuraea sp. NBC_01738]
MLESYTGLTPWMGDIHNHCGISYGHGTIEEAYANARLQLDFASVTGHAHWHDMPEGEPRLDDLRRYHEEGFARLAEAWDDVQRVTQDAHEDGRFVTFQSFEWHSMTYGDHCVYYDDAKGPILRSKDLPTLRADLRNLGRRAMALPHHIGYHRGWRGINWDTYTPEFAPVVEMVSMHGCGESDRAARPYLHTMGPRDAGSTVEEGLRRGHRFGLIGSTDHHSAHPGSHGYGRAMVWAPELTRDALWGAIQARRTYAITGDRILLATELDGRPMGTDGTPAKAGTRVFRAEVAGRDALDYVEVVRNGAVIHRESPLVGASDGSGSFRGTTGFTVGWGKLRVPVTWDVTLEVRGGRLVDVEPRLHGEDIVAPADREPDRFAFSAVDRISDSAVRLRTLTSGNPTVTTDATQGLSVTVEGDDRTVIALTVNGVEHTRTIGELRQGPRTGYTGGFVSGAFRFERAVAEHLLRASVTVEDDHDGPAWYYARVRQVNDQWAWGSPHWS